MKIPEYLRAQILEQRVAGKSRQYLSRSFGVSVSTIAGWEMKDYGKYLPTLGRMNLPPEIRQAMARAGGLAISKDRTHMAVIGRLGGLAHGPEHMSEISRKKIRRAAA